MLGKIIASTRQSLREITHPRLFESERAYAGAFAGHVNDALTERGLIRPQRELVELEPQKRKPIHLTRQRPDVIFHIPHIITRAPRTQDNYAVWAFKLRANRISAKKDFVKLDEMIEQLNYDCAFFVNVDDDRTHLEHYSGRNARRLFGVAVMLNEKGRPEFSLYRSDD